MHERADHATVPAPAGESNAKQLCEHYSCAKSQQHQQSASRAQNNKSSQGQRACISGVAHRPCRVKAPPYLRYNEVHSHRREATVNDVISVVHAASGATASGGAVRQRPAGRQCAMQGLVSRAVAGGPTPARLSLRPPLSAKCRGAFNPRGNEEAVPAQDTRTRSIEEQGGGALSL